MAYKLILQGGGPSGMPFIWNVSQHVGRDASNPNLPGDVELVQVLIAETLKRGLIPNINPAAGLPALKVDGKFSAVLGFWIFRSERGAQTVDGVVSPAQGTFYAPSSPWAIVKLNYKLFSLDVNFWSTLDDNPQLSPQLRAELKRSSPNGG